MPDTLRSLSDQEILERTHVLVADERKLTLSVLLCLNEIESRELYLKLGHGSLFDYCTNALGYSSSAAWRRIQTARCVARFPVVYGMLDRNEVNLSTVSQVSRVLDESNSDDLLLRIRDKSQREVDVILAEYRPPVQAIDRTRTVMIVVPTSSEGVGTGPATGLFQSPVTSPAARDACEKSDYCRSGSNEVGSKSTLDRLERRVMLSFAVLPEFMDKLDRAWTIAWYRLPNRASYEQIFEFLIDEFIERQDPASKQKRRERKLKGAASVSGQPPAPGKRYIPAAVRDQVFERDGGQCTFLGPSGKCCGSTLALQLDHIVPVALGGRSTLDNLRLLCAKHNRLEAERLLGPLPVAAR